MPAMRRPPERMSTLVSILASTAGWRYVLPSTMLPRRMRGTDTASADSVLMHSRWSPTLSAVFGMKWSVRHAASHPVASAWRVRPRIPSQVVLPSPMNSANRISALHGDAPGGLELSGVGTRDEHVTDLERSLRRRVEEVALRGAFAQREDDHAGALVEFETGERLPGRAGPDRDFLHARVARLAQHGVEHADHVRPEHLRRQTEGADRLVRDDGVGARL